MSQAIDTSDDTPTCGKGLAANAGTQATLGAFLSALADVFERHTDALDLHEPAGRQEHEAYSSLVRGHREAAEALSALAREMAGYRDLPMAEHDMAVMVDPEGQAAAYERFLVVRRELAALLSEGPGSASLSSD